MGGASKSLGLILKAVIRVEHAYNVGMLVDALVNVADVAYEEFGVRIVLLRGLYGFRLDVYADHAPPSVPVEIVGRSAPPATGIQDDAMGVFFTLGMASSIASSSPACA